MQKKEVRVLIVEDEFLIAMQVQGVLGQSGYDVCDLVSTGAEAIAYVKARPPDVILMDIRLPGEIDGIEAAQAIRTCCQVPIIFMSGYSDAETVAQVEQIDFAFLLEKPVFSGQLDQAIKRALGQKR